MQTNLSDNVIWFRPPVPVTWRAIGFLSILIGGIMAMASNRGNGIDLIVTGGLALLWLWPSSKYFGGEGTSVVFCTLALVAGGIAWALQSGWEPAMGPNYSPSASAVGLFFLLMSAHTYFYGLDGR